MDKRQKTQITINWPEELLRPSRILVGSRSGWRGYDTIPASPVKRQWLDFEVNRNKHPEGWHSSRQESISNQTPPIERLRALVYDNRSLTGWKNIRLLKFGSVDETAEILGCSLTTFNLDKLPAYYALSYCWGSAGRVAQIVCNGKSLMISPNLLAGLKTLRSLPETASRYFWIDQICVNQDDVEERSYQVTLMDNIYTRAEKVVIWLDNKEESPDNGFGFQLADTIYNTPALASDKQGTLDGLDDTRVLMKDREVPEMDMFGLPAVSEASWRELSAILNHPWFRRIWIIQEVSLATSEPLLIYGPHIREWSSLIFAGAWISQMGTAFAPLIGLMENNAIALKCLHRLTRSKTQWTLSGLLRQTNYALATDPRDKVFALLNICQNFETDRHAPLVAARRWISPGYEEFHTLKHVYTAAVRYTIYQENSLLALSSVNRNSACGDSAALPSWVPDFADQRPVLDHRYVGPTGLSTFDPDLSASKTVSVKAIADMGPPCIITLKGVTVDTVYWTPSIAGLKSWYTSAEEACNNHPNWLPRENDISDTESNSSRFSQHFRNVIAAPAHLPTPQIEDLETFFSEVGKSSEWSTMSLIQDYHSSGTKLFLAGKGDLGIGPEHIHNGDIICVLYGGRTPFILRPCADHFHLIGECYVPYWMDGRAVEMVETGELSDQWFCLH